MNYTDDQLKTALAKMLPDSVYYHEPSSLLIWKARTQLDMVHNRNVKDTELLHVCHLTEQGLSDDKVDLFKNYLNVFYDTRIPHSATWQQRTIALTKVKGVEL